jgi:hypothetical protein
MMDGRSPRLHLALTLWTVLLIGLILVEIRQLPPGLSALLVPYLALMARHWIGRLRPRDHIEPAMPLDDGAASPFDDESGERADSPASGDRSGYDDSPVPASLHPTEGQAAPPSRRSRQRRRTKAPEGEPLAASWIQVGPGRFVRIEEMSPERPSDESHSDSRPDDPHGATPSDEPGAPLEAVSIPADADADVPEPEVAIEVQVASQGATGATAPSAP